MVARPAGQERSANEADVRSIRELVAKLDSAIADLDAAEFDACFTADVVFTNPAGRRFVGWEEINAYHREALAAAPEGYRSGYTIERLTFPAPDVAVLALRQHVTMAGREGFENAGTWVLVRRAGAWWIHAVQNTNVT
ncbi:SgcJ/EcaC family oxidoreductase [Amycolatopsis sp. NPDC059027]|uniref:SgcJ/EcaC family oxidoreductase n=1 Tax=unclassified Amycolatopsis TaxID=2618356 RepID=UPI00366E058D